MDEDRERLERTLTPEQLAQYDELKARIKRDLTDAISEGVDATLRHLDVEAADRAECVEAFRNTVATGGAAADFEEAMDDGEAQEGRKAPETEEGQVEG